MAMNYIGAPTKFLYSFQDSACKEYHALVIVSIFITISILSHQSILEIIVVIDKIDLHACSLKRSHFYNQRMIGLVNYKVHTRQADNLMQLVTSFIDKSPFGSEDSYLATTFLSGLWQSSTYVCDFRFRNKWCDFLCDK